MYVASFRASVLPSSHRRTRRRVSFSSARNSASEAVLTSCVVCLCFLVKASDFRVRFCLPRMVLGMARNQDGSVSCSLIMGHTRAHEHVCPSSSPRVAAHSLAIFAAWPAELLAAVFIRYMTLVFRVREGTEHISIPVVVPDMPLAAHGLAVAVRMGRENLYTASWNRAHLADAISRVPMKDDFGCQSYGGDEREPRDVGSASTLLADVTVVLIWRAEAADATVGPSGLGFGDGHPESDRATRTKVP